VSSGTRRLFFALWPDEATRVALAHATRTVARHSGGKPVPPAHLHLTLAFLGAVPAERCAEVLDLGAGLALGPLALTLDRLGWFEAARVLWIGPGVDPGPLRAFVAELRRVIGAAGLPVDLKAFHPHVTLARKVAQPPAHATPHPVDWQVGSFALMESQTSPDGAQYRVIREYPACS
jgi:2'-5' RNA ligase